MSDDEDNERENSRPQENQSDDSDQERKNKLQTSSTEKEDLEQERAGTENEDLEQETAGPEKEDLEQETAGPEKEDLEQETAGPEKEDLEQETAGPENEDPSSNQGNEKNNLEAEDSERSDTKKEEVKSQMSMDANEGESDGSKQLSKERFSQSSIKNAADDHVRESKEEVQKRPSLSGSKKSSVSFAEHRQHILETEKEAENRSIDEVERKSSSKEKSKQNEERQTGEEDARKPEDGNMPANESAARDNTPKADESSKINEVSQGQPAVQQAETRPSEPDAQSGVTGMLKAMSMTLSVTSVSSKDDVDDDQLAPEDIVWEWEEELEDYDEPDIYPSEKDYIWVPVQVELASDEELSDVENGTLEADEKAGEEKKVFEDEVQIESGLERESTVVESLVEGDRRGTKDYNVIASEPVKDAVSQAEKISHVSTEKQQDVINTETAKRVGSAEYRDRVQEGQASGMKQRSQDDVKGKVQFEEKRDTDVIDVPEVEKRDTKVVDVSKEETRDSEAIDVSDVEKRDTEVINVSDEEKRDTEVIGVEKRDTEVTDVSDVEKRGTEILDGFESIKEETEAIVRQSTGADREASKELLEEDEKKGAVEDESRASVMVDGKRSAEDEEEEKKDVKDKIDSEEAARRDQEETELKVKEDEEKKAKEDEEKKAKEEEEKKVKEEEEKKTKDEEEKKVKEEAERKAKEQKEQDARSVTTDDAGDQADDFDDPGLAEPEPEVVEVKPKRYKTVLVKTLVPRPPKIHYTPEEERKTHVTSDKYIFRKRPMTLIRSYGYDCQRMANVHVLDLDTLVFMSGFVLTFYNYETGEQSYLRCIGGSCFGALAVHPSKQLFAAAEKGDDPIVGIWSWPKLQLFRKLREGTNRTFASVNFSPCGKYLATQGGDPDFLITVYNWLTENPVVRVKSHAQDVYRVTFSKELAGRLTTSGLCHIKFWKMATTFTGLKLKGDIGRFGRTELSDIEGYIEMPDGKVLSGSEWGNLLLWENGLIVAEICFKQEIPCHEGIIRQVLHIENEFYTTGQDGYIRTWPFDAVDSAEINTTEESLKVAVKYSGQVLVKENADIWYIVPDFPDESSNSVYWFAQDGKGAIWRVDLCFLNTAKEPYPVLTAHGGPIVGCATSRTNCVMATLGADGQIRVYDYISHRLIANRTFSSAGTVLLWPGSNFDPWCCTILAGFQDGTFRVLKLSGNNNGKDELPFSILLHQVRKPHTRNLTCMDVDTYSRYLATGGEDGKVFFFDIANDYAPLVYVDMPFYTGVTHLKWMKPTDYKSSTDEDPPTKLLVSLDGGTLLELMAPRVDEIDNSDTYQFDNPHFLRRIDFMSIKSELLHNETIEIERQAEEQANEAMEMENRRRIEEGLETESQQNIRLLEEAEELERIKLEAGPAKEWKPYIPPVPSRVALMIPSIIEPDEVFLSMDDYDTGYLYMMRLGDKDTFSGTEHPQEPAHATKIEDCRDSAITSYAVTFEGDFVFWGFADGRIRVQNLDYPYAFEHMDKHWTEGIHDCVRGKVTSICLDKDGVFLFTTGADGNCFLLSRLSDKDLEAHVTKEFLQPVPELIERTDIVDIEDSNFYPLEVYKKVAKEHALLAEAKKNKEAKREEIAQLRLRYLEILKKNNEMPEEIRLSGTELALTSDQPIRKKEDYEANMKQLVLETAWDTERSQISLNKVKNYYKDCVAYELFELKAFDSTLSVWSFRMNKLPGWFLDAKDKVETHVTPRSVDSGTYQEDVSPTMSETIDSEPRPKRRRGMDKFVFQKLVRIWQRKQRKIVRAREWKDFLRTDPKNKDLKEEDRAIEEARCNMGDMKLKSATDYKVPESKKLTEHRGRTRLVKLEENIYNYKSEFNNAMLSLRHEKIKGLARMNEYKEKIIEYQKVLEEVDLKPIPIIKPMAISENPNRTFEYNVEEIKEYKRQIEEKLKAAAPVTKVVKKQEGPPIKRKGPSAAQKQGAALVKEPESMQATEPIPTEGHASFNLGSFVEPIPYVMSNLEKAMIRHKVIHAKFWQDHYINKIEEEKKWFDAKLRLLRHRKLKLDYLLKNAEARLVLLTQEFILAKQSEALEASLEVKIHETAKEKRECISNMKTASKKLDGVKKEMEQYSRQKLALLNEVIALAVAKAPTFEKYLVRVFNKRMPKVKTRSSILLRSSEDLDDSDEEESSDSDDDFLDLDDEDDDGLDPDFPPQELSREVYDSVIDIRERRYKIDEVEAKTREQLDEVNLIVNMYKGRINNADREFEKGRRELDVFRKEKQEKQNVLNCAVSMKLHQMDILAKDTGVSYQTLGHQFESALVTENKTIDQLRKRIPELIKEKHKTKLAGTEMKRLNHQLHRERIAFQRRLAAMQRKCDVEMLKKFGQIRDVEELEFFTPDPRIDKLKAELKAIEEQNIRHLKDLDMLIDDARIARAFETSKSIARLHTVAYVSQRVHSMNKEMEAQMKKIPSELEDTIVSREIAFLKVVLTDQWNTISALSLEIAQLTRGTRGPLPPIKTKSDNGKSGSQTEQ